MAFYSQLSIAKKRYIGYFQLTVNSYSNVFWLFTDKSDIFNDVDLLFEYSMKIFNYCVTDGRLVIVPL